MGDLEAQIADDLARGDLTTQIRAAIQSAIRAYETDRFWFNEVRDSTVTLSTSAAVIDFDELSPSPVWFKFDRVKRGLSTAGQYIDLLPRDYQFIMASLDGNPLATPYEYTVRDNQIIFDCYASADTTIVLDGIRRISTASSSADTSIWFNDARDLIRSRARKELNLHVIHDDVAAQRDDAAERLAYSMLKGRTNSMKQIGQIKATEF